MLKTYGHLFWKLEGKKRKKEEKKEEEENLNFKNTKLKEAKI